VKCSYQKNTDIVFKILAQLQEIHVDSNFSPVPPKLVAYRYVCSSLLHHPMKRLQHSAAQPMLIMTIK
jgi:hypothetical protein